jgi:hypothetical protein
MVAYGHAVVGPLDGRLRRIALHAQHVIKALSLVCPGSRTGGRRPLLSLLLGSLLLSFAFSFAFSLQLGHSFPFPPLSLLALPSLLLRPVENKLEDVEKNKEMQSERSHLAWSRVV